MVPFQSPGKPGAIYIPPGVFPLSSGCQDPVGSEILGPERWPMQPGCVVGGVGFPGGWERSGVWPLLKDLVVPSS